MKNVEVNNTKKKREVQNEKIVSGNIIISVSGHSSSDDFLCYIKVNNSKKAIGSNVLTSN